MSDLDELQDSIIATRARRANAGSRMRSLLDNEEKMEEDAEGIFLEFEDDDEFEVDDAEDDGEDQDEEEDDNSEEENQAEKKDHVTKSKKRVRSENDQEQGVDDENFSESDEESSEEEDEDAGENELQMQQRAAKRAEIKHKKGSKQGVPFIKKLRLADDKADAERRRKQREAVAARQANASHQLLDISRRSSKRASTIKNKEEVLVRLQEAEVRRAQYVAPVVKEVHRMTQEELLEEAKITETKNRASLRFYVEQEEQRRQRQRAAMLARRVPMEKFIRYSSKTTLIPPRRIFIRQPIEIVMARFADQTVSDRDTATAEPESKIEDSEGTELIVSENSEEPEREKKNHEEAGSKVAEKLDDSEDENSTRADNEHDDQQDDESEVKKTIEKSEVQDQQADASEDPEGIKDESNQYGKPEDVKDETTQPEVQEENSQPDEEERPEDDNEIKHEKLKDDDRDHDEDVEVKDEAAVKQPPAVPISVVYGPDACRARTLVTLIGFTQDYELPSNRAKQILLGYQSMEEEDLPERKLQCVITGQPAVYIDPQTKIPYSSMQAYRIITMVKQGQMAWNTSLGGLYTGLIDRNQRHASGVPDEFYD